MTDHEQPAADLSARIFAARAQGVSSIRISLDEAEALRAPTDAGGAVSVADVERLSKVYAEATGYYVQFHRGLSSPSSDAIRNGIRAVLAALPPAPQAEGECTGCEGAPAPENNPCAVCGLKAPQPLQQGGEATRDDLAAIIDPLAAELREELARTATLIGDDRPPQKLVDDATEHGGRKWEAALAKADAILAIFASLAADRDKAVGLLRPFADFAVNVDENGWASDIHRERISDWFGPSDFRALAAFLSSQTGGS